MNEESSHARWLKPSGYFLLCTLAVVVLPTFARGPILHQALKALGHLSKTQDPLARLYITLWINIGILPLLAAVPGFFLQWFWLQRRTTWNFGVAKWVWIVPALVFVCAAILNGPAIMAERPGSYLIRMWQHFAGGDIAHIRRDADVWDVFRYTGTLIRGITFSLAAAVAEVFAGR